MPGKVAAFAILRVAVYNVLMRISLDEVQHVAKLARLDLDDAELLAFQGELDALLGHFQDMQSIDVAGLDSDSAMALHNVWSEDIVSEGLSREEALRNARVSRAGLFIVPTIIED